MKRNGCVGDQNHPSSLKLEPCQYCLINLESTTSTRARSVSLSSGITGKARKERMAFLILYQ